MGQRARVRHRATRVGTTPAVLSLLGMRQRAHCCGGHTGSPPTAPESERGPMVRDVWDVCFRVRWQQGGGNDNQMGASARPHGTHCASCGGRHRISCQPQPSLNILVYCDFQGGGGGHDVAVRQPLSLTVWRAGGQQVYAIERNCGHRLASCDKRRKTVA